jgi:hypothetical protein
MTERVDFYVLKSAAAPQRWAFACRLTEKAYLKDLKIVIVNDTLADAKALDELLWTFNERSFIPHRICLNEQAPDPATKVYLDAAGGRARGRPAGEPDDRLPEQWNASRALPRSSTPTRTPPSRPRTVQSRTATSKWP